MKSLVVLLSFLWPVLVARVDAPLLVPQPPLELTGTHGRFDFIRANPMRWQLLLCHTLNDTLDILDVSVRGGQLARSIPTGHAQGVAFDSANAHFFVSVSQPPQLLIMDADAVQTEMTESLSNTGTVALPEAADLVGYEPRFNRVFVADDVHPKIWEIDPGAKRIIRTFDVPGAGLEDFGFTSDGAFLLQAVKETSSLVKLDLVSGKPTAVWSTLPAEKPHGIAMIGSANRIIIAGGTGKLVLIDTATGQVLASASIAPRVDEIAYDAGTKRVYCASGTGVISVVAVNGDTLTSLGDVPSAPGAHSIAVDPKTHAVWIVYAKGDVPYAQAFLPPKP